jgi:hypothetical protein
MWDVSRSLLKKHRINYGVGVILSWRVHC